MSPRLFCTWSRLVQSPRPQTERLALLRLHGVPPRHHDFSWPALSRHFSTDTRQLDRPDLWSRSRSGLFDVPGPAQVSSLSNHSCATSQLLSGADRVRSTRHRHAPSCLCALRVHASATCPARSAPERSKTSPILTTSLIVFPPRPHQPSQCDKPRQCPIPPMSGLTRCQFFNQSLPSKSQRLIWLRLAWTRHNDCSGHRQVSTNNRSRPNGSTCQPLVCSCLITSPRQAGSSFANPTSLRLARVKSCQHAH